MGTILSQPSLVFTPTPWSVRVARETGSWKKMAKSHQDMLLKHGDEEYFHKRKRNNTESWAVISISTTQYNHISWIFSHSFKNSFFPSLVSVGSLVIIPGLKDCMLELPKYDNYRILLS